MRKRFIFAALFVALGLRADEGMWLYNQFPKARVEQKYGVHVTDEFLKHLRLASLKTGASASFVSPAGLILTNHHVASGCIQKVSTAGHNYTAAGFYATSTAQELKCPETEASVLVGIEDVTKQVNSAAKAATASPEANQQRRAAMAGIEKDCSSRTGNRCEVVTLYSGTLYHLYEYKKYTDIRLVFAPEKSIAFFGGDQDNFTYPRFDLDITFLRAYENGKPANTPNYLKWSREGVKEGEVAFVSGNPASTDRFITMAQFEYLRDTEYPLALAYLKSAIDALKAYGGVSAENRRVADNKLYSAENSYKARLWEQKGLNDPKLAAEKKQREEALRATIGKNPKAKQEAGNAWDEVAAAYRAWAPEQARYYVLERGPFYSDLFRIARDVVRMPEEKAKPNGDRLREYTDAALPSTELRLYSPAPVTNSLEVAALANYFRFMERQLGGADATVKAVLAGRTPERAAAEYVGQTKLQDVAERRRLATNMNAVRSSSDGMVRLARLLDGPARAERKQYEDRVEAVDRAAGSRIARARFAVSGAGDYPDATFTLRLSYGAVKGYLDAGDRAIPYSTDFAGLFRHATGKEPFKLPASFEKAQAALDPKVPLNFVSTADIIGGNSGSPTVNAKGEIIGVVFDSNLEAMPNRFVYGEERGRAVHVAGQGILEALRKVYHADRVLTELGF
jgi:Peptidase S46